MQLEVEQLKETSHTTVHFHPPVVHDPQCQVSVRTLTSRQTLPGNQAQVSDSAAAPPPRPPPYTSHPSPSSRWDYQCCMPLLLKGSAIWWGWWCKHRAYRIVRDRLRKLGTRYVANTRRGGRKRSIRTHWPPQLAPFLTVHEILACSHAYWEAWRLTVI